MSEYTFLTFSDNFGDSFIYRLREDHYSIDYLYRKLKKFEEIKSSFKLKLDKFISNNEKEITFLGNLSEDMRLEYADKFGTRR